MTISRAKLVNTDVTRWYHCLTRCVRQAFLLDVKGEIDKADAKADQKQPASKESKFSRKQWLEDRLRFLNSLFAVSVAGFAILDNHIHALVRIDSDEAKRWSPEEVARRWLILCPPRDSRRRVLEVTPELIKSLIQDVAWVEERRQRLSSIGWFMKCLKEPLARMANKADECKGTFFEGRFKSIAILDEQSLLSVCAYIDLNPVAAGIAETPEASAHTSLKQRVDHVQRQNRKENIKAAKQGSVAASKVACHLEDGLWLIPIEDRRSIDSKREGILCGLTLGNYLLLVDYTGRMVRYGKGSISPELADIFDRIGVTAEQWRNRAKRMAGNRWFGSFMASNRERLQEVAVKLGLHHLANAG